MTALLIIAIASSALLSTSCMEKKSENKVIRFVFHYIFFKNHY